VVATEKYGPEWRNQYGFSQADRHLMRASRLGDIGGIRAAMSEGAKMIGPSFLVCKNRTIARYIAEVGVDRGVLELDTDISGEYYFSIDSSELRLCVVSSDMSQVYGWSMSPWIDDSVYESLFYNYMRNGRVIPE
jgi:hypothetical protein